MQSRQPQCSQCLGGGGGHTSPCSSEPRCHTDTTSGQSLLLSVMQTAHALSLTEFTAPTHVTEQYSLAQPTFLTQRHHHQSELGFAGSAVLAQKPPQATGPSHYMLRVPSQAPTALEKHLHPPPKGRSIWRRCFWDSTQCLAELISCPCRYLNRTSNALSQAASSSVCVRLRGGRDRELDNPSAVSIGWTLLWG